jgi:hypothetical protein
LCSSCYAEVKEYEEVANDKKTTKAKKERTCSRCSSILPGPGTKSIPYRVNRKEICYECWKEMGEAGNANLRPVYERSDEEDDEIDEEDEEECPERPEKPINQHEGKKYIRRIHSAHVSTGSEVDFVEADVYCVLEAFNIKCPGRQQAIKKLLCAGLRGKGSELDDLIGALAALNRAIELQRQRENEDG